MNTLLNDIKPSATLALNQLAKKLATQGRDIVNLTTGEPDFVTPHRICQAATEAMAAGHTFYTAADGISVLKEAIAERAAIDLNRRITSDQVLVTCGAKQAIYNYCLSRLNPGEQVILLAPLWVSYGDIVRLCGGQPIVVQAQADQGFMPPIAAIEKAITERTRAIFINSPNNPTGMAYTASYLRDVVALVKRHPQISILSDDIYDRLVYDEQTHVSVGMDCELAWDQLAVVNGVSKTYAMTGWRLGWIVAAPEAIKLMTIIQSQVTSNASTLAQWGAVEALTGDQADVQQMKREFQSRRDYIWSHLQGVLPCLKPQGAFYCFPDIQQLVGRRSKAGRLINNDLDFCEVLLDEYGVAVVPGSAFDGVNCFRISFSASMATLIQGVQRIGQCVADIK